MNIAFCSEYMKIAIKFKFPLDVTVEDRMSIRIWELEIEVYQTKYHATYEGHSQGENDRTFTKCQEIVILVAKQTINI